MNPKDAEALVGYINSNYKMGLDFDDYGMSMWVDFIEKQDLIIGTEAVRRIVERQIQRPTVADVRAMISKLEVDQRMSRPAIEEQAPARELENWTRGWVMARRANDYRAWPQQKRGYDSIQIANPHYRTYVWGEQETMPEEDQKRYEEAGINVTPEEVAAMLNY